MTRRRPITFGFAAALVTTSATAAARPTPPPHDPASQLARAEERLAAGDPTGAAAAVAPLLGREPRQPRALYVRGSALCMLGDTVRCRADLEQAVALDAGLRQAWINLGGLAVAEQRYGDAVAAFRRAEALDPAAADNALNLGAALLLGGHLAEATAEFDRHLKAQATSAEAHYLVATNFALAGYAAQAARTLARAIALDEKSRVRARFDPNFTDLAGQAQFRALLESDRWTAPPDFLVARRSFAAAYQGPQSKLLKAVIDALQLSGRRYEPRLDATAEWAILWTDFRIKIANGADGQGIVEISAPPNLFSPADWQRVSEGFFTTVTARLLVAARGPAPPPR